MTPDNTYTYIGCHNGWPQDPDYVHPKYGKMVVRIIEPEILQKCRAAGHEHEGTSTKYGYHKTWCNTCKIWWDMDSGD